MKLTFLVLALVAVVSAKQFYDSKFDKINVNEIIDNSKLVKNYANCFLGKGPCTALIRELREVIKDAMKNVCDRCSPKQIKLIHSLVSAMSVKEPNLYNQVLDHFDPTKTLRDPFNRFLNSHH